MKHFLSWYEWAVAKVLINAVLKICPEILTWVYTGEVGKETLSSFKIANLIDIHRALCGSIVDEFVGGLLDVDYVEGDEERLDWRIASIAKRVSRSLIGELEFNQPSDVAKALAPDRIINDKLVSNWLILLKDIASGLRDLPVDITNTISNDNQIDYNDHADFLTKWIGDIIQGAYMLDEYTIILICTRINVIVFANRFLRMVVPKR